MRPDLTIAAAAALLFSGAIAQGSPTGAPAPAASREPSIAMDLDAAVQAVAAAAAEPDPGKARALARSAVPVLAAAAAATNADCALLAVTAEAQIRAGLVTDALATTARGAASCDAASMLQLSAWATEFAPGGARRGPGADLAKAESLYVRAADLFASSRAGDDAFESCLANAAEIARARGAHAACAEHAMRALKNMFRGATKTGVDEPSAATGAGEASLKSSLALTWLACAGRRVGEGAAADELAALFPREELMAILHVRLDGLRRRLDVGHDDPWALAAVGYYSILAATEAETLWAGRYLGEAETLNPDLPDLWYLKGRVADFKSKIEEAKTAYRRQIADHPGAPASRLAANELAHLAATTGASAAELAEVLRMLDAELARTPDEAAMIDTRGRVLLALGRRGDGISALERAQALEPTMDRKLEIESLKAARP